MEKKGQKLYRIRNPSGLYRPPEGDDLQDLVVIPINFRSELFLWCPLDMYYDFRELTKLTLKN